MMMLDDPPAAAERHRMLRYGLIARVVLLTQAGTTAALAWASPGSLSAQLLEAGGEIGQGVLLLMTALVLIGWLDVLVNDCLPGRWQLRATVVHEHSGYLALGAVYWMQAMAGAGLGEPGSWVLVAHYTAIGSCCCWFGWVSALRGGRHG